MALKHFIATETRCFTPLSHSSISFFVDNLKKVQDNTFIRMRHLDKPAKSDQKEKKSREEIAQYS